MRNSNLGTAKKVKNDEFYTRYEDIEKELMHYEKHFEGQVVYCNCDDPDRSNFVKYFKDNFSKLKLKKLIASSYTRNGHGKYLLYYGDSGNNKQGLLEGDGDFRSPESIKLLDEADIVVGNPPFSLFREYVAQLVGAE